MSSNCFIIGKFVRHEDILCYLEMLKNKYGLNLKYVFVYTVPSKKDYLVTFRAFNKGYYLERISGSMPLHTKNGTIFSINALNRYIETKKQEDGSSNKEYIVDWSKCHNKLLLVVEGKLVVDDLNKVEDLSTLFFQ